MTTYEATVSKTKQKFTVRQKINMSKVFNRIALTGLMAAGTFAKSKYQLILTMWKFIIQSNKRIENLFSLRKPGLSVDYQEMSNNLRNCLIFGRMAKESLVPVVVGG